MNALIQAGAELFAERGLSAVSVRDVAVRARVNHGLVHHYFGSKEDLLRGVVQRLSEDLAKRASFRFDELFEAAGRSGLFRIQARLILDGHDIKAFNPGHAIFDRILAVATQAKEGGFLRADLDPKLVASMGVALHLGWLVFEPHLMNAAGHMKRDRARVRAEIFRTYLRLILSEKDVLAFGSWIKPSASAKETEDK
jgi:TetR/AcrR family transcriptional regulator, repressor for neighboring sulfatase